MPVRITPVCWLTLPPQNAPGLRHKPWKLPKGGPIPTVLLLYNRTTADICDAVAQINPFAVQLLALEPPQQVETLKREVQCQLWKSVYLPAGSRENVDVRAVRAEMDAYRDAGADFLLLTPWI